MKFFGEYLIEKNLISKSDLISALLEQVKNTPSAAEICFDKALIDLDGLLHIFRVQFSKKIDFQTAAKELKKWNSDIEQAILAEVENKREPIGAILCRKGLVNNEQLAHALDDFFSKLKTELKSTQMAAEIPQEIQKNEPTQEVIPKIENDLNQNIDTELLKEMFSNERKMQMTAVWNDIEKFEDIKMKAGPAESVAHLLKGVMILNNLVVQVDLFQSLENVFKAIQSDSEQKLTTDLAFYLCQSGNSIVEAIWNDISMVIEGKPIDLDPKRFHQSQADLNMIIEKLK